MSYSEEKLWDEINAGWSKMSFKQRHLWEAIKLLPEQWEPPDYGQCWVVAIIGNSLIYYNHHEMGFDLSRWVRYGYIEQYQGLQYGLEDAVQRLLMAIETGYEIGPWGSEPMPGEYPGA